MKKTFLASFVSTALLISTTAVFADHAPAKETPTTPYASSLHPATNLKAVNFKQGDHSAYPTNIVVLNYTASDYQVQVNHPPVIDDSLVPNGYDRITNMQWFGLTDLHIYHHGMKIFDDYVGNHAIVSIYPDGVDVENVSV